MNPTASASNTRFIAISIVLFTAFLFLFNTGKRDLWAPDEPRYAQVSKEMKDSGNFIVPHLNSEPYAHKPPLLFWLINVISIPFGKITALSSRLPSAFAGIGCSLAMFYFGKYLYRNTRIGILTALILATSIKFLWMAHRVAFDVLLTFFVIMAIMSFYYGYTAQKNKVRNYTLFYIFMALGVLTKGPVGFILPFLTVLTYLILKRTVGVLKETKPWIGGVLFFTMVFSWVFLASHYGGKEYTQQILFKQNVGRFTDSFAHKQPFYYFFINFPLNFFPWTFFIPSFVLYLISHDGRKKTQNILLPVTWFSVIFVFFSIVSGKRDVYVLPLYPAASLFIAWFLNEFIERFREVRFKKIGYLPCYILSGLSLFLGITLPIVVVKWNNALQGVPVSTTVPFTISLFIGGIMMLRFLKFSRILPFLFTLIFLILTIFTASTLKVIPILNQYKTAKEICDKANLVMGSQDKLAIYKFFRSPYIFYTERNYAEIIKNVEDLSEFMNSKERVFLFIREKDYKKVTKSFEIPMFVLEEDSVGHRKILFVSNKDIQ